MMRQLKEKCQKLDKEISISKHQLGSGLQQLQNNIISLLTSPKVIAGFFLTGFLGCLKGSTKKPVFNFARRHLTSLIPFASMPLLGKVWRFYPLVQAYLLHKKTKKIKLRK